MGFFLLGVAVVLIYGLLALALAVPAGVYGSLWLSRFLAAMFNFDLADVQMPASVHHLLALIVGLLQLILNQHYLRAIIIYTQRD